MAAQIRRVTRTMASPQQLAETLSIVWWQRFNDVPTTEAVGVLWAQIMLETGRLNSCVNWNVGGIKAGSDWNGDVHYTSTTEWISAQDSVRWKQRADYRRDGGNGWDVEWVEHLGDRVKVRLYPNHRGCRFRAYPSLTAGVSDYMDLLYHRFALAWSTVQDGDPGGFAAQCKQLGYYTAPLDAAPGRPDSEGYRWQMTHLHAEFMRLGIDPLLIIDELEPTDDQVLALIGLTADGLTVEALHNATWEDK